MPLPLLAMAGMSAAATGLSLWQKKKTKPPLAEHTFQGKRLRDVAQRGYYTPEVRSRILSETARTLGAFAQRSTASTKGQLARIGVEGSVAGVRTLGQAGREYGQAVQRQSSQLSMRDVEIKASAKDQLASLMDVSRENRRAWREDFSKTLTQGVGQAMTLGTRGMMPQGLQMPENLAGMSEEDVFKWAYDNKIPWEEAEMLYYSALAEQGSGTSSYYTPGMQTPR